MFTSIGHFALIGMDVEAGQANVAKSSSFRKRAMSHRLSVQGLEKRRQSGEGNSIPKGLPSYDDEEEKQ